MTQQHGAGNLPVSATQVDQSMMIQGLPNNAPIPQVQVDPQLQQLLPMAAGYLLSEVQNNAQKNPLRVFLFNFLSRQRYQNPDYQEAVSGVLEYTALLSAKGQQPQQAVMAAASEMAGMLACVYARKFPQLMQMMPAGSAQEIDQWLARMNQIRAEIDQLYRSGGPQGQMGGGQPQASWGQPQGNWGQQQQPGWGSHPRNQPQGGMGMQQNPWGQPQGPMQGGPMQGGPMQGGFGGQPGGFGMQPNQPWGQPPMQQNPWGAPQGGFGGPPIGQHHPSALWGGRSGGPSQLGGQGGQSMFQDPSSNMGGQPQGSIGARMGPRIGSRKNGVVSEEMKGGKYHDYRTTGNQAQSAQPEPQASTGRAGSIWGQADQQTPTTPIEDGSQGWDPENDRLFDYAKQGDVEFVPAHLSNWKKSFSLEQPYSVAWDPKKVVLFHSRDKEGKVREVLKDYEEGMDYLEHELEPSFRAKAPKESDGEIVPNWELLERVKNYPSQEDENREEKLKDVDPTKTPLVMPKTYNAFGYSHAKFQNELFLLNEGLPQKVKGLPYEFYYNHILPYYNAVECDEDLRVLIAMTASLDDIDQFAVEMTKNHGRIPEDLWNLINDAATEKLNTALQVGMGLSNWEVDSFSMDWADLEGAFTEEFGEEQGEALHYTLKAKAVKDIVQGGLSVVLNSHLSELLDEQNELIQDYKEVLESKGIFLSETCSVTQVPWRSDDISLVLSEKGGVVIESKLPELYKAVKGVVERTRKSMHHFSHRYIVTADNVALEIHEGLLGKNFFILRPVDLPM